MGESAEALRAELEQQQLRERGLVAVIESARDLVAMRDLDQVLQAQFTARDPRCRTGGARWTA